MILNHSHQAKLFDPKCARKVVLFGAGSVGSYVVLLLTKMGVTNVEVWDADVVSSHNVPMSLYRPSDIGRQKVDALQEIISMFSGVEITVVRKMYEGAEALRNASVIACVDSMTARKTIWGKVKKNPSVDLFVDTRVGQSFKEVLAIAPCDRDDIKRYEALLFSDEQASRQMCGEHGIAYVSASTACSVAANVARYWQTGGKKWRDAMRCDILESA